MKLYIVIRKDNGYPLVVYPDYETAKHVAETNGELVVEAVTPNSHKITSEGKEISY